MGYLLISSEVAMEKGLKYFEKMPDGRAILDFGMLRVLGNVAEVELVGSSKSLKAMIKEQNESGLYNQPDIEDAAAAEEVAVESVTDNGYVESESVVETESETSTETETNNEEELTDE